MIGNTVRLGRLWGIEIRLHYSWFLIFLLVAWSLATVYFPQSGPGWSPLADWALGLLASVLFFACVLAHELAHSAVSAAYGVPVSDITLYIYGGAAHISREPRRAREEFLMALAGPATSLVLAALCGALARVSAGPLQALAGYLAFINGALGLFNLIPGFPLDGGRVLRAVIWSVRGDLRQATRIATAVGRVVATGFILVGIWLIFAGYWANGLWIAFIGWFLDSAAASSAQHLTMEETLAGHTVREVMSSCPTVGPHCTLEAVVEGVILPGGRRCVAVVDGDDRLVGLLTLHRITAIPRDRWRTTGAAEAMIPLPELKTVRPEDDLAAVFDRMTEEDINQYPVVGEGRLVGLVARDAVMGFLRLCMEIGPVPGTSQKRGSV